MITHIRTMRFADQNRTIMFPTIFSLATKGLGRFTSSASGVLCTAIVGGAVVPVVQGWAADTYGLMISFVVSAICYVYIVFFAIKGYKADEYFIMITGRLKPYGISDGLLTLWHNDLNDRRKKWPKSFCCMACICIRGS